MRIFDPVHSLVVIRNLWLNLLRKIWFVLAKPKATTFSITTLSIMTFSITTRKSLHGIKTLRIMALLPCSVSFMLNVIYAECHKQALYAECPYADCPYAERRYTECRSTKPTSKFFSKIWKIPNLFLFFPSFSGFEFYDFSLK